MRTVTQDTPHGDLQAIAKELREQKHLFCDIEPRTAPSGYLQWAGTFCRLDRTTNNQFIRHLRYVVIRDTYEEALADTINNIVFEYKVDLDSLFS